MKHIYLSHKTNCFLLIFLCFLWTSCGYLSWLYRLMKLVPETSVDLLTEVVGYLFQALGLLLFSLIIRRRPKLAGHLPFTAVVVADLFFIVLSVSARSITAVLIFGYCMNVLHGAVAGMYLYRLATMVEWQCRSFVFGASYASASIGSWLLSFGKGANFLRSPFSLVLYSVLVVLTVVIVMGEKEGHFSEYENSSETVNFKLIILAGVTVFLLSLVKGLGFSFPSADISRGINLELSRVFYAIGLVAAGIAGDMERKYGAICCIAALGIPFLMIALSGNVGSGYVFWVLGYVLFGFFSVFRIVLFSDIARKNSDLRYLAGFGLLFGRIGDAAGTACCISLSGRTSMLVSLTAVLYAVTVIVFFIMYQKVYLPAPLSEKTEEERFKSFSEQYELSVRECEVLQLVLAGESNPEIAGSLYISESTVKFHIHNLLKKTECANRVALVRLYQSL